MAERKWWPLEWADEVMPAGRSSPDEFIIKADGDYFLGYAFDAKDVSDSEKRTFSRKIDSGDIIEFLCCDQLGEVDIHITPSGTWSASGPVPQRATLFWLVGDYDSLSGTMDAFVANYLENEPLDEERTETVSMAWWSDGLPHKFTLTYEPDFELKASFVAVSTAEAKQ